MTLQAQTELALERAAQLLRDALTIKEGSEDGTPLPLNATQDTAGESMTTPQHESCIANDDAHTSSIPNGMRIYTRHAPCMMALAFQACLAGFKVSITSD